MKLALLNTSIITSEGTFEIHDISLSEARKLAQENYKNNNIFSAVGHASTAQLMTTLLDIEVPIPDPNNRPELKQELNQKALVFKLNGRAPEGAILSVEEIEAIGYKFQLLTKIK